MEPRQIYITAREIFDTDSIGYCCIDDDGKLMAGYGKSELLIGQIKALVQRGFKLVTDRTLDGRPNTIPQSTRTVFTREGLLN
ncbi:hypothetical protein J4233_04370 [Candidatus Pacearchaeota archaeon]|nr:hypothetical protein [Candidatus Pacearchaeota archaeon]